MGARIFESAKDNGIYSPCGLCSGQGPLKGDEGLSAIYSSLRGHPERMEKFLNSDSYAVCAGIQMFLMTRDKELGLALGDYSAQNPNQFMPLCAVRGNVPVGRNGNGSSKRVSLETLNNLVSETLYARPGGDELPSAVFGTKNPEFADYIQKTWEFIGSDENEENTDRLGVQERLIPIKVLDRPRKYDSGVRAEFEANNPGQRL